MDAMPKVVDIASKRAAFVLASLDVIASEGLGGATLRRIAAQAGATTGSITHYFSSRDALLVETVAAAHLAAGVRMQAALERCENPEDQLEAVVLEALPLDPVRLREWKVWLAFRGALGGEPVAHRGERPRLRRLARPAASSAETVLRRGGQPAARGGAAGGAGRRDRLSPGGVPGRRGAAGRANNGARPRMCAPI